MTDSVGRYAFEHVPPGTYVVTASKRGFAALAFGQADPDDLPTEVLVSEDTNVSAVDISLACGASIAGVVIDEMDRPVDAAIVSVQHYRFVGGRRRLTGVDAVRPERTSSDGRFTISDMADGEYLVSVSKPGTFDNYTGAGAYGYARTYFPDATDPSRATPVHLIANRTRSVVIRMTPLPVWPLKGTVRSSTGGFVSGGAIRLMRQGEEPSAEATSLGDDGSFAFELPEPKGTYDLVVSARVRDATAGNHVELCRTELVVNRNHLHEQIQLITVPGWNLAGRIESDVASVRDVPAIRVFTYQLGTDGGAAIGAMSVPVHDGRFELHDLFGRNIIETDLGPNSRFAVKAIYYRGKDITASGLVAEPGQHAGAITIVLTDKRTQLRGAVTDRTVGSVRPVVLAFAQLRERWDDPLVRYVKVVRATREGEYSFSALPSGKYYVVALPSVNMHEVTNPSVLEHLRPVALRVELIEGQLRVLDVPVLLHRDIQ